jgi:hypothetical protein
MAYFANSSEGLYLENECCKCKFGESACPIYRVQVIYNYDACNVPIARKILDELVKDDGACAMLREFPEILAEK